MFKKSLLILLFCGLITLAWIVGYVLLCVRGPVDALRDAQAQLALGQYAHVISVLDQAENSASIQKSVNLQLHLWRIRAKAHASLDNPAGALKDVRSLLANGFQDDIELRRDEIRYLATDGQGEMARLSAKKFLGDHPDDSRGLELAGEACQTAYQPLLHELRATLDRELSKASRDGAKKTLLTYLYRPATDPLVKRAGAQLEGAFTADPRLQRLWPQLWADARALRERIQEGLDYFQKSLDLGGETVAAFRAIATALEQSGRIDDLLLACEIQRRMFDHNYVVESGVLATWVRLEHNVPKAAIATAERWLPKDQLVEYTNLGKITTTTEQLLLARALAAWRLHNKKEINAAGKMIIDLREIGFTPLLPLHLSLATRRIESGSKDPQQVETSLRRLIQLAVREPAPLGRPDLVAEFAPEWINILESSDAGENAVSNALKIWRNGRPETVEPHLRTAQYLLSLGRTTAALAAIDEASAIDPDHAAVFPLHLRIARRHHENSAQDGNSLLKQCVRNRATIPETRNPIGYVLCAEAALSLKEPKLARIVLACARNAIGAYPRANIPRQLELKALILGRQFEEAARVASLTVQAIRPDATTLAIAIEAKKAAGESVRELLRMALPRIAQANTDSGRLMQLELVRLALADAPTTAHQFVTPTLLTKDATVEQRALAIHAYIAGNRLGEALAQLRATRTSKQVGDKELQAGALAKLLLAMAETAEDAKLLGILQSHRMRLGLDSGSQLAMFEAAEQLAETHPRTSFDMFNKALPAAPPEERNGQRYVLAGDLALKQKDSVRAESYWMAALAFPDGAHIAERLARLLLVLDKDEAAAEIYALTTGPTDPALAARFGLNQVAAALLGNAGGRDPNDLLTHAAFAMFSEAPMIDWKPATDEAVREARLDLVAGLRDPLLGWLCVSHADKIRQADPRAIASSLLMARAACDAGQAVAAGVLHANLFKAGYKSPVLWREVAYAGQQSDYVTSPELTQRLIAVSLHAETGNSELTLTYSAEQAVKGFEQGGFPELAQQTRLLQWQAMPHLRPCTPDDLELITTRHTPQNACVILDKILRGPHPCDRDALLGEFYRLAGLLVEADEKQAQLMAVLASGHIAREGARGLIVHFLLNNRIESLEIDAAKLLRDHLVMIANGQDNEDQLNQTMDALLAQVGIVECNLEVESLLAKYPTSLPLWTVRAALRARLDSDPEGLSDLRTVLTHTEAPQAQLRFLGMAAAERRLSAEDIQMCTKLPKALLDSPTGAYVQALMALRQGQADEAVVLFAKAAPQHDGRHLFDLALAHLEGTAVDGVEKATAALQQLVTDYPKSSLSQNAGSFIRQLSPRP